MNQHQDWCQLPYGGKSHQLKSYEVLVHDQAPPAHPLQSDDLTNVLPSKKRGSGKPSKFRQNSDSDSCSDSDNEDDPPSPDETETEVLDYGSGEGGSGCGPAGDDDTGGGGSGSGGDGGVGYGGEDGGVGGEVSLVNVYWSLVGTTGRMQHSGDNE